jgi:hypothetical protein
MAQHHRWSDGHVTALVLVGQVPVEVALVVVVADSEGPADAQPEKGTSATSAIKKYGQTTLLAHVVLAYDFMGAVSWSQRSGNHGRTLPFHA